MIRRFTWMLVALALLAGVSATAWAQPTTRESEDLLKAQGLTRVGTLFLLDFDAKLEENLRPVNKAQVQLNQSRRRRAAIEQEVDRAEEMARQWARERQQLSDELTNTRNTVLYNNTVNKMNTLLERMKEAERFIKDRERELETMEDPGEEHARLASELADKLEETAKQYQELAEDQGVQETLARLNATRKWKLGPSPRFTTELAKWRKERANIGPTIVKLETRGGVPVVDVTINGKLTKQMVFDSGASLVTLTASVANELGITPGEDDPTVTLVVADGREVKAHVVRVDSLRVADFTVENVRCAILPASMDDAECLLGGTFLRRFSYRMDIAAKTLRLTPVDAGVGKEPATKPAGASVKARSTAKQR